LGDVILTLPVLDKLCEVFPDCRVDYITKTQYSPIIECHPAIGRIFTFKSGNEFRALAGEVFKNRYDYFIDLQANFRSRFIGFRISNAKTIRYKKRRLARELIVRRPGLGLSVEHTVKAYLKTFQKIGIEAEIKPPILHLPSEAIDFARGYYSDFGLNNKTVVALCPGARHHEKKWPWENYRDLAQRLFELPDIAVLVFSAASDNLPGDFGITNSRLFQARDLTLTMVAALLSRCRAGVTNDSGLMHLANSVGVPVVAIFGPTNPRLGFAPTLQGSRVLCDNVACSPCSLHGQRKCHQPRKICFDNITSERVFSEVKHILERSNNH
jgi:lipopolysaccharide heptosyltransferase II